MRKLKQSLIALLLVTIAGCGSGGGGGSDSSNPPVPKNEWDNMNWDEGQWA